MSSTQEAGDLFGPSRAHAMLRSPTVLIASVGLWGMNIYFFRIFGIDYVKVLKWDLWQLEDKEKEKEEALLLLRKKDTDPDNDFYDNAKNTNSFDDDLEEDLILDGSEQQQHQRNYLHHHHHSQRHLSHSQRHHQQPPSHYYEYEYNSNITWFRLVSLSGMLLFLLHTTYFVWIDLWGGGPVGAVLSFYMVVSAAIMMPSRRMQWLRKAVTIVLQRSFELFHPRCFCLAEDNNNNGNSAILNNNPSPESNTSNNNSMNNNNNTMMMRPVPFVDVFFADAMCSLSKVFFDWGILIHMAAHPGPVLLPATTQTILIPSLLAAIPYVIRTRQCILMYSIGKAKADRTRFSHLWNALKYSTSIFPLCLSAYSKTVSFSSPQQEERLEHLLIWLLTINACYALYWDIVMDWGMMQQSCNATCCCCCCCCCSCCSGSGGNGGCFRRCCNRNSSSSSSSSSSSIRQPQQRGGGAGSTGNNSIHNGSSNGSSSSSSISNKPTSVAAIATAAAVVGGGGGGDINKPASCGHAFLRPRLRFGVAVSALILLADAILRFGWVLRFYKKLFPTEDSFVLCTQFLEVFRRALWNLLRVEWENIKQLRGGGGGGSGGNAVIMSRRPSGRLIGGGSKDEEMTAFLSQTHSVSPPLKKVAIA